MEKFTSVKNFISNFVNKQRNFVKEGTFSLKGHSSFVLSLGELILFYPIELGLGLHPDVRQVIVNFMFSTSSIEERYFFLRQAKIPVSHL